MACEISIIVPTYNERDNVAPLIHKLRTVLLGINWEVIFVDDDSPDGTSASVKQEMTRDTRVRLICRKGKTGLSSACIDGMLAAGSPYLVIMDGDMQHDETILPSMLELLRKQGVDLVIASRYMRGAGVGRWSVDRVAASWLATRLTRLLTGVDLSDPLSGYFMLKKDVFLSVAPRLRRSGYKILLDIVTLSTGSVTFCEIPYVFRLREFGKSKLSIPVLFDYNFYIFKYFIGRFSRPKTVTSF